MPEKRITFDPYQQKVIAHARGYAVAMAAPGSGKTSVIIARIQRMLSAGLAPEQTLCLTFTKEAASEMNKRAGLEDSEFLRDGIKHKLFTTFHSWALAFIKHEALALPFPVHKDFYGNPSPLCLPLDAARTMAQIVRRIPDIDWKDAASYTSAAKRRGITPNAAQEQCQDEREELYILAYRKYEESLRSKGLLDFDSIVIESANLLESRADVRERWQFRQIQIDEAQDTDAVQWRIVKALSELNGNALGVGDENQGMYSWRGSESYLADYFTSIFPSAVVLPLPVNYRSTGSIVEYCKKIAPIQNETITKLSTPNETGVPVEFNLYPREDEEAKQVLEKSQYLVQFEPNSSMDNHGKISISILARTNRQLAAFEDAAATRNIPYKLLGKSGFWGQPEVKDTIAILGAVAMPSDNNVLRMLTARCDATKFLRKDSRDAPGTITLLKKYQEVNPDSSTGEPVKLHKLLTRFSCGDSQQDDVVRGIGNIIAGLRHECATLTGRAAMQRLVDRFGLLAHYDVATEDTDDKKNFDNDPRDNILKLLEYSGRYASLALYYDYTQRVRRSNLARSNCLILSTIHQAKGKEWGTTFVTGVSEGMLPHKKGDLEEEKRIYLVACSRARKRLFVSASGIPSELIKDEVPKPGEQPKKLELDTFGGFQLHG